MGRRLRDRAWEVAAALPTPSERLVLIRIAELTKDDVGEFYGSIGKLAEATGLHHRSVRRIVTRFRDAEILVLVEERPGRTTRYLLNLEGVRLDVLGSGAAGVRLGVPRGRASDTESVRLGVLRTELTEIEPRGVGQDVPPNADGTVPF